MKGGLSLHGRGQCAFLKTAHSVLPLSVWIVNTVWRLRTPAKEKGKKVKKWAAPWVVELTHLMRRSLKAWATRGGLVISEQPCSGVMDEHNYRWRVPFDRAEWGTGATDAQPLASWNITAVKPSSIKHTSESCLYINTPWFAKGQCKCMYELWNGGETCLFSRRSATYSWQLTRQFLC